MRDILKAVAVVAVCCLAMAFMFESCASSAAPEAATAPKVAAEMPLAAAAPVAPKDATPLPVKIPATDANILYTGRIDFSKPDAPSFAFPGVCIEANFTGRGIDVLLDDTKNNYFDVSIDGGEPLVIETGPGMKSYAIARDLAVGAHYVRVYKRTESNCGVASFGGFLLEEGRSLAPAPAAPSRKVEFIGDSITCGYGIMVSTDSPSEFPFKAENENSDLAWGRLTAKALRASFVSTSYSGRGVFRNYDGSEEGTLPKIFGEIYPDSAGKAAWDFARYVPDLVFINLGTNDMSSQVSKTDLDPAALHVEVIKAYKAFIAKLRAVYGPAAKIVCAVGPMIGDGWPAGCESWTRIQESVSGMVSDLNKAGDANVFYLCLEPQTGPWGEDWHPTAATQALMAKEAVALAKKITGW